MSLTQSGKLLGIGKENQVTESFKKRLFWLQHGDNPEYLQITEFQLSQDKTDIIDHFKVGETIEVSFNLRGRKWTNKEGKDMVFNTLDVWKIVKSNETQLPTQQAAQSQDGDLPF